MALIFTPAGTDSQESKEAGQSTGLKFTPVEEVTAGLKFTPAPGFEPKEESGLGDRLAFEAKDLGAKVITGLLPEAISDDVYEGIRPEGDEASIAGTAIDTIRNAPAGLAQMGGMAAGETANLVLRSAAPASPRLRSAANETGRMVSDSIQSLAPVNEADPRSSETQKLFVEGVGPGIGQYTGLAATALLNPAAALTVAPLISRYDFRESALQRGATEQQADMSAALGAVVSPTELIAPTRLIQGLNKGGFLRQSLDYASNIGIEAAQEAFMEGLKNLDANTLQKYNEEVGTLDGTAEAAQVGGYTAAIVDGVARLLGMRIRVKEDPNSENGFDFEAEPLEGELLPPEEERQAVMQLLEMDDLQAEYTRDDGTPAGGGTPQLGVSGDGGGSTVPSPSQSSNVGQPAADGAPQLPMYGNAQTPPAERLPLLLEPHIMDNKAAVKPMNVTPLEDEIILGEDVQALYDALPDSEIWLDFDGLDSPESWYYGELIHKVHTGETLSDVEFATMEKLENKTNQAVAAKMEGEMELGPEEAASTVFTGASVDDIRYGTKRVENPQEKTPQFKRWFGDSKAVDSEGRPLRLYHGTTMNIDNFKLEAGGVNTGAADAKKAFFFTTSPKVANGYAMGGTPRPDVITKLINKAVENSAVPDTFKDFLRRVMSGDFPAEYEKIFEIGQNDQSKYVLGRGFDSAVGANVMPVYLSTSNPLVLDVQGREYDARLYNDWVKLAQDGKFDSLVLQNVEDSYMQGFDQVSDVHIVFNPASIKSAIGNKGTFRLGDSNIMRSKSPTRTVVANGLPSVREETIKGVVERVKRVIPGLPEVVIYDGQSQLARAPAAKEALDPTNKGFYLPASISGDHQIYINADAHTSDREVQETLVHELVTHYGLRKLIASPTDTAQSATKKLEPIMLEIYDSFKEEIRAKVIQERQYKLDLNTDEGKAMAAEEWVASVSETMRFDKKFKALWNKLVTFVMQQLRKVSALKNLEFIKKIKRAEVEDLLQKSFDNLKKQPKSVDVRAVVKARSQAMDKAYSVLQGSPTALTPSRMKMLAKGSDDLLSVVKLPQFQDTSPHSLAVVNEALQEQMMPMDAVNYPNSRVYMAAGENVYLGSAVTQETAEGVEIVRLQARSKALAAAIVQKEFKRAARFGHKRLTIKNPEVFGLDLKQLYGDAAVSNTQVLVQGLGLEEVVLETESGMAAKKAMQTAGLTTEETAIAQYRFDKFSAFSAPFVNLVQISTTNRHIPGVNKYFTLNLQTHGYRKEILGRTERLLERFKSVSAADQRDIFNAMLAQEAYYDETQTWIIPSESLTRIQGWTPPLADQATREKFVKRFNLNEEKIGYMNEIADNLFSVLEELESLHIEQIRRIGIKPENVEREFAAVRKKFDELKKRPYLPRMRFGDHTVRAVFREDGEGYKKGDTYTYEAFPSKREARARAASLEKEGYNALIGKQNLDKFRGIGMLGPEFLELVKDTLDMTDEQKAAFKELTERYSNVKGLAKHFEQRRGVKGYSREWTRAFASYMMQAAYGMANVKYRPAIAGALNEIIASVTHLQDGTGADLGRIIDHATQMEVGTRADIAKWYQKHFDYMMSPDAEISTLNSLAFINYLWAVPKSAIVNLTQLPVMTFPFLAKRYGAARTIAHMTKNIKYIGQWKENPDFDWSKAPEVRQAIEAARREGLLDETLMRQISNAANGLEVSKQLSSSTPAQWFQELMIIGGIPFNSAEKFNRLMSFVSAFTLESDDMKGNMREELKPLIDASQNIDPQYLVEKKWGRDQRYIIARSVVNSTQFLFGKLNRPQVFRGSAFNWLGSMLTPMFGIAWATFKDRAGLPIAAMIALLAGTEGIPFIQYGYTSFDIAATKFLEQTKDSSGGWQLPVNSRMAVREFQREMLSDIIDNPDIVSTGLLGPEGILNVSSSVEMGDPFYLAQALRENVLLKSDREKETLSTQVANSFTVLSMINSYHGNIFNSDTNLLETGPLAISNIAKAYKWQQEGGIYSQGGVPLIEFGGEYESSDLQFWGKALGFQPPALTQGFEEYQENTEAQAYWTARREDLRKRAKNARTEDKVAAVNGAIQKYNSQIPSQSLRLPSVKLIQLQQMKGETERDLGLDVPAYSRDRYR